MNAMLLLVGFGTEATGCPRTEEAPVIDGILEQCWSRADSVKDFKRSLPYWGQDPTESTTVYLMHDDARLFIAFRCQVSGRKPDLRLTQRDGGTGDEVKVMLDTYGSGITGYRFAVSAAGTQSDARVSDDGRDLDFSWDGVWDCAVRVQDTLYTVEMAIPFKTLRYGPGPWAVGFIRAIPAKNEDLFWPLMPQNTGFRLSLAAKLDINPPPVRSLHLELYPVALAGNSFIRSGDYSWDNQGFDIRYERGGFYSEAGADATWAPSPSIYLQTTLNPDFAQVEADPFQLNLTKYELWLRERRPFFVEGADIFDFPIRLFYSRRIGQSFSAGAKITGSGQSTEYGALVARCEPYSEVFYGDTLSYASALYYAARAKTRIFSNSNLGVMGVGTEQNGDFNRAGGVDWVLRGTSWNLDGGLAASSLGDKRGLAAESGYDVNTQHYWVNLDARWSEDSFDVSEIGFFPSPGSVGFSGGLGPSFFPSSGPLSEGAFGAVGGITKEAGEDVWAWGAGALLRMELRGGQGIHISSMWTRDFELDSSFWNWNPQLSLWTDWRKPLFGRISVWRSFGYNYNRGYFASQMGGEVVARYTIKSGLAAVGEVNAWVEKAPDNSLESITLSARPKLSWLPVAHLNLSVYAEPTLTSPRYTMADARMTRLVGGAVLSWEFAPKSWVWIVYNHAAEQDSSGDSGDLSPTLSEFQAKIKYLLFI